MRRNRKGSGPQGPSRRCPQASEINKEKRDSGYCGTWEHRPGTLAQCHVWLLHWRTSLYTDVKTLRQWQASSLMGKLKFITGCLGSVGSERRLWLHDWPIYTAPSHCFPKYCTSHWMGPSVGVYFLLQTATCIHDQALFWPYNMTDRVSLLSYKWHPSCLCWHHRCSLLL